MADKINKKINDFKKIKQSNKGTTPKFNYYRSDGNIDYFDKYTDLNEFGKDIRDSLILDHIPRNKN